MPLKRYSLLKGVLSDFQEERDDNTPHFQIQVDADGKRYRIAVNVMSAASPSELKYIIVPDFQHPVMDTLEKLEDGMHKVESTPGGIALDYIRGNLFDIDKMKLIPHDQPGADNDLNDLLSMYASRAREEEENRIYAFGEKWGPENKQDPYFHFKPGRGIHDIHMNQGNYGKWKKDNGVYQDGGLLFHFPERDQWVGIFLAFQSQAIHTNDVTGHPIEKPEPVIEETGDVRIVAALVNPAGADEGRETVTLINISNHKVDLNGWKLLDRNKSSESIPSQILSSGKTVEILLSGKGTQLGNKGGQITLLTPQGLKAHGVSYTKKQVKKQGWTIVF